MASSDYRLCDVCGNKTFYDADLNYGKNDYIKDQVSPRRVGKDVWDEHLEYLGDWSVICNSCAKTHKTQIIKLEEGE